MPERHHVVEAVLRTFPHRLQDRLVEGRWQQAIHAARRPGGLLEVGHEQLGDAAGEGEDAGEHLVGHHSQCIDVGSRVHRPVVTLLRRHVLGGPHDHPGGGLAAGGRVPELGDPEVEELHEGRASATQDEDVVGLEVAVDHAPLVRAVQGVAELAEDGETLVERHGSLPEQRGEGLAVQVLHDDVVPVGREHREVEDADDVLVADAVHRPGLVVEAGHELRARRHRLVQELDGDAAPDDRVLGEVDRAHPASSQQPHDAEAADGGADERVDHRGRLAVPPGLAPWRACLFRLRRAAPTCTVRRESGSVRSWNRREQVRGSWARSGSRRPSGGSPR